MRLIDIEKTFSEYNTNPKYRGNIAGLANAIKDSPVVDAVEVVRCKDCVHWFGDCDDGQEHSCDMDALLRSANHFCAFGKRKEST